MKTSQQLQGQFMTPPSIARLLVQQLRDETQIVVDFSAGDGSLLIEANRRFPNSVFLASETDEKMMRIGTRRLPRIEWRLGDGLTDKRVTTYQEKSVAIIGNPPYTEFLDEKPPDSLLLMAFPGLTTLHGRRRKEFYFLAKALVTARKFGGIVSFLMPIGFADGDYFKQYRKILMENYALTTAIEIPSGIFSATEVRTILIRVDTSKTITEEVQIARYTDKPSGLEFISKKRLEPGERIDSKYHLGKKITQSNSVALCELGVSITRGTFSRKEAHAHNIRAIHTSDLGKTINGELNFSCKSRLRFRNTLNTKPVYAEPGDILISRTGKRVSWRPVLLRQGVAPITDHVFRIRPPKGFGQIVRQAFFHRNFPKWLEMNTKGACASILTKTELLKMPVFDYQAS